MKTRLLPLLAVLFAAPVFAQTTTTTPVGIVGTAAATTVTIALGTPVFFIMPVPPQPPITVIRGAHIQFVVAPSNLPNPVVTWYKDGKLLAATGTTLDIPTATFSDSGSYSASAHDASSTVLTWGSASASVLVTNAGQRLRNVSTRARIDANQPTFLTGFVVEPGPSRTMVLVRAVGPTLTTFGVADALAAPKLRVNDASGREITPYTGLLSIDGVNYPNVVSSAAAVGAFPLPTGGKDVAQLYLLGPGAYTAQVSSADGGSGTALLEIYEVPY